jgi:uncharacterized protein YbbC (DUF1343 family)
MDQLLAGQHRLLEGRRIGLLTHPAALTVSGHWSATCLLDDPTIDLVCLMAPEHGIFGHAGPGETVAAASLPPWNVPVHSLYGANRAPPSDVLAQIDALVIDLQDLGVRCYTYLSTLALALEAAAHAGVAVLVADRPIPLPGAIDGPALDPAFRSFVAQVDVPMIYGLTQAETATLLAARERWDLDLDVIPMQGYQAKPEYGRDWPPWVPPSPGIRSWESAWCYPATVFTEAFPSLDCGRQGPLPFQILGAPWLHGTALRSRLDTTSLPGVRWVAHPYCLPQPNAAPVVVDGVRIVIHDPTAFRPITTGLTLLQTVQELHGTESLWEHPDSRPAFFDQLCGTNTVREALQAGVPVSELAAAWHHAHQAYAEEAAPHRLYA